MEMVVSMVDFVWITWKWNMEETRKVQEDDVPRHEDSLHFHAMLVGVYL